MITKQITVSRNEVEQCIEFALDFIANDKSDLDFGNSALPRSKIDRIGDCAEGKIGELAFVKYAKHHGIDIKVDFNIEHGRLEIDGGQDIQFIKYNNAWLEPFMKVDIKTSRTGSSWLLVEDHKYGDEWADAYVFITTNLNKSIESNLKGLYKNVDCMVHGFSYSSDFIDEHGETYFQYDNEKNNRLVKPSIVKSMIDMINVGDANSLNKSNLINAFMKLKVGNSLTDKDIFMGVRLKCPSQKGLPVQMLRSADDDYKILFDNLIEKT